MGVLAETNTHPPTPKFQVVTGDRSELAELLAARLAELGYFQRSQQAGVRCMDAARLMAKASVDPSDLDALLDRARTKSSDPESLWAFWISRGHWKSELEKAKSARRKPEQPKEHVPNMPLGSPCCGCGECAAYRLKKART